MAIRFKLDHIVPFTHRLYEKIKKSGFKPDHIIMVAGDGLFSGFLISKEFNVPVHVLNLEQNVYPDYLFDQLSSDEKVLVVDAANSTGTTISTLKARWGDTEHLKFAVITHNTDVEIKADYFVHVHDSKVEFLFS